MVTVLEPDCVQCIIGSANDRATQCGCLQPAMLCYHWQAWSYFGKVGSHTSDNLNLSLSCNAYASWSALVPTLSLFLLLPSTAPPPKKPTPDS